MKFKVLKRFVFNGRTYKVREVIEIDPAGQRPWWAWEESGLVKQLKTSGSAEESEVVIK